MIAECLRYTLTIGSDVAMEPFRPFGEDSAMGYYEVPVDVVEDPVRLAPFMRQAINVAADARRRKRK